MYVILLVSFIFGNLIGHISAAPSITDYVTKVNIIQHPYFVHIGSHCGGAILSDKWVITAAACINNTQGHVYVGGETKHNSKKYDYDYIATLGRPYFYLLHLKTPLNFSSKVQPISLPERFKEGWAHLITHGKTEDDFASISSEECECEYNSDESNNTYEDTSEYYSDSEECICEPKHTLIKSDVYAFTIYNCERNCDTENGKRFCGLRKQKEFVTWENDLGSPLVRGNTLIGIVTGTDKPNDCRNSDTIYFANIVEFYYYIWYMTGPSGS